MSAIEIADLYKFYDGTEILKGVNLELGEGEFYTLMGPNGSGKTTLTSIIAGVNIPSSGMIRIYGYDLFKDSEKAKNFIGYVPQENFSSPYLSGYENLMYFLRLYGFSKSSARELVTDLLEKMGLQNDANKRVSSYSGGMRKKLEVATALLPGIRILILDEPTTGLDPSARKEFLNLLKKINQGGTTIFFVTHIGEDALMANRIGFMDEGKIVIDDDPEHLKHQIGIHEILNIDLTTKNQQVEQLLQSFSNNGKIIETTTGYRTFCDDAEELIPRIVKALNEKGFKTTRIEVKVPSLEDIFFKLTKKVLGGQQFE
ncbi:MAG: ABC transporter ATP-binding protein [Promethearchaeota archaeon]|nr:MAG: ABC transporter ATP-binding protein [Candidatus Lokiarchaeota archaeon]